MSDVICADCGTKNTGRVEFCVSCGAFLAWEGVPEDAAQVAPQVQQSPRSRPAAPGPAVVPPAAAGPEPARPEPVSVPRESVAQSGDLSGGFSYSFVTPAGRTAPMPLETGTVVPGSQGWAPGPAAAQAAESKPAGLCARCGTVNEPQQRFCRKCGLQLVHRDSTRQPGATSVAALKVPWWRGWLPRGWFRGSELGTRAARRAFRRSLPMGLRLRRGAGIAGALAAVIGLLFLFGTNPVAWVKDRIADLRGSIAEVADVRAAGEPSDAVVPQFPAEYATDNLGDTSWAVVWRDPGGAPPCVPTSASPAAGTAGSLLVLLPRPTTVRAVTVAGGLPAVDPRRPHQFRPKALTLAFSDGTCQQVNLTDTAELQQVSISPVATDAIRVTVSQIYPPLPEQPMDLVGLSEFRVLARP